MWLQVSMLISSIYLHVMSVINSSIFTKEVCGYFDDVNIVSMMLFIKSRIIDINLYNITSLNGYVFTCNIIYDKRN